MKKKKEKVRRRISFAGGLLICFAIVAPIWAVDFGIRTFGGHDEGEIVPEGEFYGVSDKKTKELEKPAETTPPPVGDPETNYAGFSGAAAEKIPDGCVTVPLEKKNVTSGSLLLLDSEHPFTGVTGELVTFAEKNDCYRLKHTNLETKSEVVDAMNKMASAYYTVTGRADLMVYSTTAAYDVEGSLYPTELPDRATGYCIDLCILNEDETISKIQSNVWLESNAHIYGFVFSYTEADAEENGIDAAPYHLRYVGKEHAGLMHEQGLTLRQYLKALEKHSAMEPMYYAEGGANWSVYYVPLEVGGTEAPVPLDAKYDISGNNTDGFVIKAEGLIGG